MRRAVPALALLILPGLGLSLLITLGHRDWVTCLHGQPPAGSALAQALAAAFASPLAAALSFGPFAGFALLYALARRDRTRRVLLGAAALFALFCLWTLWPPATQHDCDRKGDSGAVLLPALILAGWLAALAANKLNCLLGACVPDTAAPPPETRP